MSSVQTINKKFLVPLALGAGFILTAEANGADVFDLDAITADARVLASDEFEGRAPGTAGEKKSIDFITERFNAVGLQPGGDLRNGQRLWTQAVPMKRFNIRGKPAAGFAVAGQTLPMQQGEQIAIRATQTGATEVDLRKIPVVFAGYGVQAPERQWDDFKGVDVKGKLLLVLVNDPDYETGEGDFDGKGMTYHGRWTYKYEEAARQGAAGVLVIHETAPASYGWWAIQATMIGEILDIQRKDPAKAHTLVEGWLQREPTVDLFKRAGLDFEALKRQARTRDFRAVELKGVTFSTKYSVGVQNMLSHNVIGELSGKAHRDEHVVFVAHWDALGIGEPDASGDRIYNGAVNNAGGVALMIDLARAFREGKRPERSLIFVSTTAQETGFLGAAYYAENPPYPLETTIAALNIMSLPPLAPARDFSIAGRPSLTLVDDLIEVASARKMTFTPDPRPEAGQYYRFDHTDFARAGVPALTLRSGEDLIEGGKAVGSPWAKRYNDEGYRKPADELGSDWRSDGIAATGLLFYDLGLKLANSRDWPRWRADGEFRVEREKTDGSRR